MRLRNPPIQQGSRIAPPNCTLVRAAKSSGVRWPKLNCRCPQLYSNSQFSIFSRAGEVAEVVGDKTFVAELAVEALDVCVLGSGSQTDPLPVLGQLAWLDK